MFKFSQIYKRVALIQLGLCLIVFVIGAIVLPLDGSVYLIGTFGSYALGLAVGYIFSCIKLFMLEKTLERSVDMDKEGAASYTRLMYMARYFLTIIFFIAAALSGRISLLGLFLSVILLQPAALIAGRAEKDS